MPQLDAYHKVENLIYAGGNDTVKTMCAKSKSPTSIKVHLFQDLCSIRYRWIRQISRSSNLLAQPRCICFF